MKTRHARTIRAGIEAAFDRPPFYPDFAPPFAGKLERRAYRRARKAYRRVSNRRMVEHLMNSEVIPLDQLAETLERLGYDGALGWSPVLQPQFLGEVAIVPEPEPDTTARGGYVAMHDEPLFDRLPLLCGNGPEFVRLQDPRRRAAPAEMEDTEPMDLPEGWGIPEATPIPTVAELRAPCGHDCGGTCWRHRG